MRHTIMRNASYDYARLAAVIGIIWFHARAPGATIGYSGLAFFVMLLMVLALPQILQTRILAHRAPAFLRYAALRGRRLLIPWVAASIFYGGLKLVEVSQGMPFSTEFNKEMWLTGTATHLWFLPFAFAMGLLLWPLAHALRKAPEAVWIPLSLISIGAALMALAMAQTTSTLPDPLAQWAYAMPAVLLGVAMSLTRGRPFMMIGLLLVFICAALSAAWIIGLVQIALAGIVLILCTAVPLPPTAFSAAVARASLWIYLIHPAIMTLVLRSGVIPAESTGLALVVTILSLITVAIWETIQQKRTTAAPLLS